MNQGVIIVGLGPDYLGMALNLCLSIKSNTREQSVTLITDKRQDTELVESIEKYFDQVISVGELGAEYPPFKRSMFLKLKAHELSPYDRTLLLDADSLILPGKNLGQLIDSYGRSQFVAYNNGCYDFTTKKDTGRYNYWCNPVSAGKHFNIPATAKFPQINASFIYFRKSKLTESVFHTAIAVWFDKEYKHFMQFNGSKTEEFCFNVAFAKHNITPWINDLKVYKPIFIPLHHETWSSEEYLYQTFKGISLAGYSSNNLDDRLTKFYNTLVQFYGRIFQADNLWQLTPQAKRVHIHAKVFGYWHVCLMGNWKTVVIEQLQMMVNSGLMEKLTLLKILPLGNSDSYHQLKELISIYAQGYEGRIKLYDNIDDFKQYEFPTLDELKNHCNLATEMFFGFYLHTKGVSQPDQDAKIHWRNYLNHYTITHWEKHYKALSEGYDLSGVNWLPANGQYPSHFSGNFWWFNSAYIANLPGVHMLDQSDRFQAEMWVGKGKPKKYVLSSKIINDQKSEWFPMRKVAILFRFDLTEQSNYRYVREQLTALQDSGLLAEAYSFAHGYCNNPGCAELKLINEMFEQVSVHPEKTINNNLELEQFYGRFMNWCLQNPEAYILYLKSGNDKRVAQVNQGLVYDWRFCYNKLLQGATRVFVPSPVQVSVPMLDSYWATAVHVPGSKPIDFKLLKYEV